MAGKLSLKSDCLFTALERESTSGLLEAGGDLALSFFPSHRPDVSFRQV